MRRSETFCRRREGYTLIELLVVIAIIALLAGLLLQAIVKIREVGPRVRTKAEIGEMELAIESFKSTYPVKYVPTALVLSSNYAPPFPMPQNQDQVNANQAMADSQQYLSKVWPKASWSTGAPLPLNTFIPLDGNQVLVFLLGGVPPGGDPAPQQYQFPSTWQGNRSGFFNSPTNPFYKQANGVCISPPTGDKAKGPFFQFKAERLDNFAHYHDPFWDGSNVNASVYYYFSSKNGNDYSFFGKYYLLCNSGQVPGGFDQNGGYGGMDPFVGGDNKYVRSDTFQIISAGKNARPGPGGVYTSGVGSYSPGGPGGDDIANFHSGVLGGDE